jgi:hypothetical protein
MMLVQSVGRVCDVSSGCGGRACALCARVWMFVVCARVDVRRVRAYRCAVGVRLRENVYRDICFRQI